MAINIITEPTTDHIPVSDCMKWELQPDTGDVFTVTGTQATVVVTFPTGMPTPGTPDFTMWGQALQVLGAGSPNFGASFFRVSGIAGKTAEYFANMVKSNLFFRRAVSVGVSGATVTITWDSCGPQTNFGGASMDFAPLTGAGATVTVTNGTTPEKVEGYKMTAQLLMLDDTAGYIPVDAEKAFNPVADCSTVPAVSVDYMPLARNYVFTPMPDLDAQSFIPAGNNAARAFVLRYGSVWRENCQPVAGNTYDSDPVIVLNAAYKRADIAGVRRYIEQSVEGLPSGQTLPKWLTTQPGTMTIFSDSFAWLWGIFNKSTGGHTHIHLRFSVTNKAGSLTNYTHIRARGELWQVECFNVSPAFLTDEFSVNIDNVAYYDVTAYYGDGTTAAAGAMESMRYIVGDACGCCNADIYFLSSATGICTMPVTLEDAQVSTQFIEVLKDVQCGTDPITRAKYGGRTVSGMQATQSQTWAAIASDTKAMRDYFADMKAAPQHWVRVPSTDGGYVAQKIIVESGNVQVFTANGQLILTITGSYDVPTQAGIEPPITAI